MDQSVAGPRIGASLALRGDDDVRAALLRVREGMRQTSQSVATDARQAGDSAREAVQRSSSVLSDIQSKVGSAASSITSTVGAIGTAAAGVAAKLAEIGTAAGIGGLAAGAGFLGLSAALGGFVERNEEALQGLNDLRDKLGLSVEDIQRFQSAIRAQGGTTDGATASLSHLSDIFERVREQGDTAGVPFAQIGVSLRDSEGNLRSFGDVLNDTLGTLAGMASATDRVRAAQTLFGSSYQSVVDLVKPGTGKGENLTDRLFNADKLGVINSQSTLDKQRDQETDTSDADEKFRHLGDSVTHAFLPLVGGTNPIKQWLADNSTAVDGWLNRTAKGILSFKSDLEKAFSGDDGAPLKARSKVTVVLDKEDGAAPAAAASEDDDEEEDSAPAEKPTTAQASKPERIRTPGPGQVVTVIDGKPKLVDLKTGAEVADDDEEDDDGSQAATVSLDNKPARTVRTRRSAIDDYYDDGSKPKVLVGLDGKAIPGGADEGASGGIQNSFIKAIAPELKAINDAFQDLKGAIFDGGTLGERAPWLGDLAKTVTNLAGIVGITVQRIEDAFSGMFSSIAVQVPAFTSPLHLLAVATGEIYGGFARLQTADPSSLFVRIGGALRGGVEYVVSYVQAFRTGDTAIQHFTTAVWTALGDMYVRSQGFLDALWTAVKVTFGGLIYYATQFGEALHQAFTRGAVDPRNSFSWITPLVTTVVQAMDAIHAAILGASTYPSNMFAWLPPLVQTVGATLRGLFNFATLGPIGRVVGEGLKAIVGGALYGLYEIVSTVGVGIASTLYNVLSHITFDDVVAAFRTVGVVIKGVFLGVYDSVMTAVTVFTALYHVAEPVLAFVAKWLGFVNADGSGNALALVIGYLIYEYTSLGSVIGQVQKYTIEAFAAMVLLGGAVGTLLVYSVANLLVYLSGLAAPLGALIGLSGGWVVALALAIVGAGILIYEYWDSVKAGASAVGTFVMGVFSAIGSGIMAVLGFFAAVPGFIVSFLTDGAFRARVVAAFVEVKNGIIAAMAGVIDWFKALPGRIVDAVKSIPGMLKRVFNSAEQNAFDDAMADPAKWTRDNKDNDFKSDEQRELDRVNAEGPAAYKAEIDAVPETWAEKWRKLTGGRGILGLIDPTGTAGDSAFDEWLKKIFGKANDAAAEQLKAPPSLADQLQQAIPDLKGADRFGGDYVLDFLRNNGDDVRSRGFDPDALAQAFRAAAPDANPEYHDYSLSDFGPVTPQQTDPWAAMAGYGQSMQAASTPPASDFAQPPTEQQAPAPQASQGGVPLVLNFPGFASVTGVTATPEAATDLQNIFDSTQMGQRAQVMRDSTG